MRCYCGIDLGSTTTKAVILDDEERLLGRGITNSRSNYDVACDVARTEAYINARFGLFRERLERSTFKAARPDELVRELERGFRREQYALQHAALRRQIDEEIEGDKYLEQRGVLKGILKEVLDGLESDMDEIFGPGAPARSDFFRDIASSGYMSRTEAMKDRGVGFDVLMSVFDKSIIKVENERLDLSFSANISPSLDRVLERNATDWGPFADELRDLVIEVAGVELTETASVGTGYGRSKLPFAKEQIRSEILCHGLGAHWMFPGTRTVLDIGGQDTKAIQIDEQGIVTSFQMNDRCAAGCGRYLGYIADEMNVGLHELGPLAQQSSRTVRISSTCTVFAGAELRDRLTLGERREDILAGLHRAMMLRAMSLLARSGGVDDEFTFTGGVAKNPAAVNALRQLVSENYGERVINISPDSIYTGAVGAALFARRDLVRAEMTAA
ncbi:MAG: benzoyl-CoA reductase subunit A [Planctomycetes bacterium]|nr:benzoyl-CoA reductase subunit A [Planctomycetota bacterium]